MKRVACLSLACLALAAACTDSGRTVAPEPTAARPLLDHDPLRQSLYGPPIQINTNTTCSALASEYAAAGVTWLEVRIEQGEINSIKNTSGTYTEGPITISNFDGTYFDWS